MATNKSNDRPTARTPRSLSGLAPFLRPYRGRIALAGLFLVMAALSTLAFPVALKSLIDQGVVAADPADRVMALRGHFLALFGVGAAQGLGQIRQLAGAFVHQFGEVTAQTLEFLRRLLALGDVAGDAQDTDDLAMAVQHGTLDRLDQAGLGAAGKGDPLLVHVRLARAHRQEVVLAEQRGLLG